ncbi:MULTISPECIES: hypothetical protein [Bradyrhizobium]|uniref:hypothetical protein n=1 Tax=Bradyrhizobium TaxID=374 RepID=UPI001BAA482C|nr:MULTISPECIES: hypothetical protein [Bradyrhizobium]MBR1163718.1 hypothetical protein [Bradyrhizobium elkanii]MCA1400447.1 hypothetical protein [Bradyrhizobium sp. BRP56]
MTDQVKLPVVEQQEKYGADVGYDKPDDHCWLLDRLEDDDVREVLKHDAALTPSKADGRVPYD